MELSQARAVVTGGARGLGRYFALELARAGAQVTVGDVDNAGLRRLRSEAKDVADKLSVATLDVSDEGSVCAFVDTVHSRMGGIDVLLNNAGILRDGLLVSREEGDIRKLPHALWTRVLEVNLTGSYLMAREVSARMIADGVKGVIVNISSLARHGNPGQSSYAASKAGLDACTRTWALELARYGIRVGGVAPGVIDTPIVGDISPEALEELLAGLPVRRLGTPHEVWQVVRVIIECEFMTGRTLEVDGGASMG